MTENSHGRVKLGTGTPTADADKSCLNFSLSLPNGINSLVGCTRVTQTRDSQGILDCVNGEGGLQPVARIHGRDLVPFQSK